MFLRLLLLLSPPIYVCLSLECYPFNPHTIYLLLVFFALRFLSQPFLLSPLVSYSVSSLPLSIHQLFSSLSPVSWFSSFSFSSSFSFLSSFSSESSLSCFAFVVVFLFFVASSLFLFCGLLLHHSLPSSSVPSLIYRFPPPPAHLSSSHSLQSFPYLFHLLGSFFVSLS